LKPKNLKQTLILIIALLTATPLFASHSQTDSILAALPQLRGEEKLEALKTLVNLTDNHLDYLDMLVQEARRQKHIEMEAFALAKFVEYYFFQFNNDSIFVVAKDAIQFLRKHKFYHYLFAVQQNVIMRHSLEGRILTALLLAEEAYEEAKEMADDWLTATMLKTIAGLYNHMEKHEEALLYYKKSQEMAMKNRQTGEWIFIGNYYSMIDAAMELKRYHDALQYSDSLQVEIERFKRENPYANLQSDEFVMETNRATLYARLKQPEKARQAIERAHELFDAQWEGTFYEAGLYHTYSLYHHAAGNYAMALEYVNRTIHFLEDADLEIILLSLKRDKAQILFDMGEGMRAAELAFELIEKRNTLNTQRFYAQINELRTIFELDKAEMEIVRRQAQIERQRLVNTGLIAGCFAMTLIAGLIAWSRRKIAQKNRGLYRQIAEAQPIFAKPKQIEDDIFERLSAMMKEQMLFKNPELKREEVAEKLGISDRRLYDCIVKNAGVDFTDYINEFRLLYARELLLNKDNKMSIEGIATSVGFKSRTSLYTLFQKKYGISPGKLQKMHFITS